MKYYKKKTVVFYIFVATIMSFDLKGNENENEGNCPCCDCCKEEEKKEEKNNENKEDTKDKKKEGEKKDEEKKEGEGGEGGDDGGYEGGDEGEEEEEGEEGGDEGGDEGEEEEEKKDDDEEEIFIQALEQCFKDVINEEKFKKYVGKNKGMKERLFIVDLNEGWNEIVFEKLKDNLSELFSYKEKWSEKKLLLNNLSLISYCPKDENNEEFEICEFKMNPDSTIKDVFDYFENASTWVNEEKKCLILFIKDQDGNIVSLTSIGTYGEYIYTIYKEKNLYKLV